MADNIDVTPGTGKTVATKDIASGQYQKILISDPTTGTPLDPSAPSPINGATAADAALTVAPVTVGGLAKTANPTAVADADVVNALFDKLGKQVVVGGLRDLRLAQTTTITSSTAETTIVTAAASTFHDLYGLIISNTSVTDTDVEIRDATAGTLRGVFSVKAGTTAGFMLDAGSAWPQTAVNNNWTADCADSVASIYITALYVKNT